MITGGICTSFISELPQGLHNFLAAGDTFNMALYDNDAASLNSATTVYTTTGEVTGTNYSAGGIALTPIDPYVSDGTTIIDFENAGFTNVTLSNIGGALIYNATNGNRAVAVLKFNVLVAATAQDIVIQFPGASVTSAIMRITNG